MPPDPLICTGLLVHAEPPEPTALLGTCAAFRRTTVALTATHCVRDVRNPRRIRIEYPRLGTFFRVSEVHFHPEADLALLVSPEDATDIRTQPWLPFRAAPGNWGLGEEFMAYGYPTEGPSVSLVADAPTPRLFRGHYQRFFEYSEAKYRFIAGELSIPAPAGFSGGPVFRPDDPGQITGIVAGNIEAYSTLSWREEVQAGGERRVEMHHRLIEYGVAVMLSPVEEWLNDILASLPVPGTERT